MNVRFSISFWLLQVFHFSLGNCFGFHSPNDTFFPFKGILSPSIYFTECRLQEYRLTRYTSYLIGLIVLLKVTLPGTKKKSEEAPLQALSIFLGHSPFSNNIKKKNQEKETFLSLCPHTQGKN